MLPLKGAQIQSLVWELRPHKLYGAGKKKKKKKTKSNTIKGTLRNEDTCDYTKKKKIWYRNTGEWLNESFT